MITFLNTLTFVSQKKMSKSLRGAFPPTLFLNVNSVMNNCRKSALFYRDDRRHIGEVISYNTCLLRMAEVVKALDLRSNGLNVLVG